MIEGICICEPGLLNYSGHGFNYSLSVYMGARKRQLDFRILASTECLPDIQTQLPIMPIFSSELFYKNYHARVVNLFCLPVVSNRWRYRELIEANLDFLNERWIVFSGTTDASNFFALSAWLRRFPPHKAPSLVHMLRISLYPNRGHWSPHMVWSWLGLRFTELLAKRYRIHLVSDSQILAQEFGRITRLPVKVLPIPHLDKILVTSSLPSSNGSVRFVSLGMARRIKGFDVLSQSVERLCARQELRGLNFILQSYFNPSEGEAVSRSVAALKRLNSPAIQLIEHPLGEPDYNNLLYDSDVVLVPYKRAIYHANTSGTFAEALAAGKPVVATDGTWMSTQLERYGAGVAFLDQDVDDLARAICEARDNYPSLAAQAQARRADWVAYHNPDNFIDELLKVVNGPEGRM